MNGLDYLILGVVLISALIGIVRGFIRETFSLVSWIASLWIAFSFVEPASKLLVEHISQPALRVGAAFAGLFVSSLLLLTTVSFLIHRILPVGGIKGTDRVLGGIFGVVRALVIIAGLMLAARLANLPSEPWWQASLLARHFEPLVALLFEVLPADMSRHLQRKPGG